MSRSSSFFFFRWFKGAATTSSRSSSSTATSTRRPAFAAMAATVTLTKIQHDKRPAHHMNDTENLFENPWPSFMKDLQGGLGAVFKMRRDWQSKPLPPKEEMPQVIKPDWGITPGQGKDAAYQQDIKATWLGHACFLVEFPIPEGQDSERGYRLLFDPVFSHRCSPSQWVGPARYTPPPIKMEDMPEINGVVISHAHYDHLDVSTIKHLFTSAQPKGSVHFFVPLGNKKWFASAIGTSENDVTEFDWWDNASFTTSEQTHSKLRITCTPCQHFANRSIWDRNHTLWASWAVEQLPISSDSEAGQAAASAGEKPICKIWFGGDTAYKGVRRGMTPEEEAKLPHCPAFEEIGDKFKFFDFAMIPIGAYSPRWFMSQIHASPEDAVCIHKDVRSRKSVGMHWATWMLTDEEVNEPKIRLAAAVKAAPSMKPDDFTTLEAIGATLRVKPEA